MYWIQSVLLDLAKLYVQTFQFFVLDSWHRYGGVLHRFFLAFNSLYWILFDGMVGRVLKRVEPLSILCIGFFAEKTNSFFDLWRIFQFFVLDSLFSTTWAWRQDSCSFNSLYWIHKITAGTLGWFATFNSLYWIPGFNQPFANMPLTNSLSILCIGFNTHLFKIARGSASLSILCIGFPRS